MAADPEIDAKDLEKLNALIDHLQSNQLLPTHLLKHKETFSRYLRSNYYDVNMLKNIAMFYGLTPMTGVNTINNLLSKIRIPKQIPTDTQVSRWILMRQCKTHYRRVRREDVLIDFERLDTEY